MNTIRTTINGKLVMHEVVLTISPMQIQISYFKGLNSNYLQFNESQYFNDDYEVLKIYDVCIVSVENGNIETFKHFKCKLADIDSKIDDGKFTIITLSFIIK